MIGADRIRRLEGMARQIRRDIVEMVYRTKDGHPSPSMSAADLITALYFDVLKIDPSRPDWEDRDRFILSKGHACPALYSALARKGYFSVKELFTLRLMDSHLQGHPYASEDGGPRRYDGFAGQWSLGGARHGNRRPDQET